MSRPSGATARSSSCTGWDQDAGVVGFKVGTRLIRIRIPLPNPAEFQWTPTGKQRTDAQVRDLRDQATRQRWRALALVIKAKLEAVESGIATFEDEFLAYTMLPTGATVGEWAHEQLELAYQSGQVPELLPGRSAE